MTKNDKRREKFRKIGEAITAQKERNNVLSDHCNYDPDIAFEIKNGGHVGEIPGGPQFKTPQWERTVKR